MAKNPKKEENEEHILPLPRAVIEHHSATLAPLLKEWKSSGHVPPVLLFTGIPGVGKRSLGYYLAQWVFCERNGFGANTNEDEGPSLFGEPEPAAAPSSGSSSAFSPEPCGECAACSRALHGTWVDFTEILPEADGDSEGRALKVDQFRELKRSQGFGAHEGGYRFILIPNADRMTVQAANSMLKILEEPPRGWIFFLTAADPSLVLPTVLSRCQQHRLRPFDESRIEALVLEAGFTADRARLAARLAQGSWGRALALAAKSDDEFHEERGHLVHVLDDPGPSINPLVDWGSSSDAAFDSLLTQLEALCGDLIRWSVSGAQAQGYSWQNSDATRALEAQTRAAVRARGSLEGARAFWVARSESLMKARIRSKAPLNRKILLQDILVPWLEIR